MTSAAHILPELIRIPSVNPMGRADCDPALCGEERLSAYLSAWLEKRSISFMVQPVSAGRNNIIACLPASSPSAKTMLWEVHQDTVPTDTMTIPPFGGALRDGKIHGRGACDVKGSMASMLAALERLALCAANRPRNLMVAFTVDEEHTFLGVQKFAADLDSILPQGWSRPSLAIVAEPTGLDMVVSHKGVVRWKIQVGGRACHSSMPWEGVNAVFGAAPVLEAIESLANRLAAGKSDPVLGPPTLSVGMIRGGIAPNVVPDSCEIVVDRRLIPGESAEEATWQLRDALQAIRKPGISVMVEDPWLKCPPLPQSVPAVLLDRLRQSGIRHWMAQSTRSVAFGTDASTLAAAGIPAFVFGPGSIDQAHTKDEWIAVEPLELAVSILVDWALLPLSDDI